MTNPNNIENIFDVVGSSLPQAGIDFLLIGGHAVNLYGYSRATIDVDFMIAASDMEGVRSVMKTAGFTNISESENVVFFNQPDLALRVDFLQIDTGTMKTLLSDAREVEYGGQLLLVPSLANLIAMKLFALKTGSAGRWEKDSVDIVHLVLENELDVDGDLKPLCDRFADNDIFSKLSARILELTDD